MLDREGALWGASVATETTQNNKRSSTAMATSVPDSARTKLTAAAERGSVKTGRHVFLILLVLV